MNSDKIPNINDLYVQPDTAFILLKYLTSILRIFFMAGYVSNLSYNFMTTVYFVIVWTINVSCRF